MVNASSWCQLWWRMVDPAANEMVNHMAKPVVISSWIYQCWMITNHPVFLLVIDLPVISVEWLHNLKWSTLHWWWFLDLPSLNSVRIQDCGVTVPRPQHPAMSAARLSRPGWAAEVSRPWHDWLSKDQSTHSCVHAAVGWHHCFFLLPRISKKAVRSWLVLSYGRAQFNV